MCIRDRAYVDFGADSAVGLIDRYDNLLVVQTLSKSRSLAGARVGFAMGSEELIEDLNRIKFSFNPYNLNRLSILAGAEAMKDRGYFETTRKKIIDTREHFVEELKGLGFRVLPSKANFVFAASDRMRGERFFKMCIRDRATLSWNSYLTGLSVICVGCVVVAVVLWIVIVKQGIMARRLFGKAGR